MFLNLGPLEVLLILVVALLVLGPTKLPEAARQAGRAIGELRRMTSGVQAELRDALQEPLDGRPAVKPVSAELPDTSPVETAVEPAQPTAAEPDTETDGVIEDAGGVEDVAHQNGAEPR
ncbi:hypothetical protein BH18ACT1_BH18ACT1_10870 [soil metagenome]